MAADSEIIKAIAAEVIGAAIGVGVHPRTALDIAHSVEARLSSGVASSAGVLGINKRERNERIRQAFNGRNHRELCQSFGVSIRTLYRVVGDGGR